MKDKAVSFYRRGRGNCAEAVASVFSDAGIGEPVPAFSMSDCGHGRAPGGICGALYAGCVVAGEYADIVEDRFREKTGDMVVCRDVRRSGMISCCGCVALVCDTLEEQFTEKRIDK